MMAHQTTEIEFEEEDTDPASFEELESTEMNIEAENAGGFDDRADNVQCDHYTLRLDVPKDGIYACVACNSRFEVSE